MFLRSIRSVPAWPGTGWLVPVAADGPRVDAAPRGGASLILLIAIVSAITAGCHRHIQSRAFVPPPVVRRPFVPPPMPYVPEAPAPDAVEEADVPLVMLADLPSLPPPPEPPKKPVVIATPKPAPPPPVTGEPIPSPRLGQIFTADQLREYNRALDESMSRARTVLAVVAGRRLNPQQSDMVGRIRTFMMQADQARQKDLVTAVNLARRADLLARDLSGSLP